MKRNFLGLASKKPLPVEVNIGISEADRQFIAEGLSRLLADSYTLYLKTHNYHWNVEGPLFHTLHLMFEEQYKELAIAVDLIAERIRALGLRAPGTYSQFSALSAIKEDAELPRAQNMIRNLLEAHEIVIETARAIIPLAEKGEDEASVDLIVQRIQSHEKTAWMLRSLLKED